MAAEPAAWLFALGQLGSSHSLELPAAPREPAGGVCAASPDVALLLERWVRRVAIGGDGRRGVARLELAEGPLAGGSVTVISQGGGVSIELRLPAAASPGDLGERLRARFARRGVQAEITLR